MNWEAVASALAVGVPSLIVGILAYRRSRAVDAVSAEAGMASSARNGTALVLTGLNTLIENLQEDNQTFRENIKALAARLDDANIEIRSLTAELHKRPTKDELLETVAELIAREDTLETKVEELKTQIRSMGGTPGNS